MLILPAGHRKKIRTSEPVIELFFFLKRDFFRNFEQAERKIDKKLKTVKKNTQQIMEASSIAYEQREDAKTKHANQRERSEKELSQYNSDIKQLERLNENHFNLKVFMENKNQERTEVNAGPR